MFVAKNTHQENLSNDAGNHVSRTPSVTRAQEAGIQGLDCLPVSFHSELRARESYPKVRRRKRHFASLQDLFDGRRLVIEDGAHRRADRNLEKHHPLSEYGVGFGAVSDTCGMTSTREPSSVHKRFMFSKATSQCRVSWSVRGDRGMLAWS